MTIMSTDSTPPPDSTDSGETISLRSGEASGGGISGPLLMSVLNDKEAAARGAAAARTISLKTFGKHPPPAADKTSIQVPRINECTRCGGIHVNLEFQKLDRPMAGGYTHWATCPNSRQPIMLMITERPDPILIGISAGTVLLIKHSSDDGLDITYAGPNHENGKYSGFITTPPHGKPLISTTPCFESAEDAMAHMRKIVEACRTQIVMIQEEEPASVLLAIKAAHTEMEAIQTRHKAFGAADTESDLVYQMTVSEAFEGLPYHDRDADGWELYTSIVGVEVAALDLNKGAAKIVELIQRIGPGEKHALFQWACSVFRRVTIPWGSPWGK